jgi:hypothetical protein
MLPVGRVDCHSITGPNPQNNTRKTFECKGKSTTEGVDLTYWIQHVVDVKRPGGCGVTFWSDMTQDFAPIDHFHMVREPVNDGAGEI